MSYDDCESRGETGEETGYGSARLKEIIHPDRINAITISGRSGCGNTTVNRLVAEKLGLEGINYTMRNYAKEQGVGLEELSRQAEENPDIDCMVDRRQVEICLKEQNVVLSSRLAIWLLPQAALKVYLYAPLEVRSRRIQEREGGSPEEQLRKTEARDLGDAERYRKLYRIVTDHFFFADLIINTETFDQYQVANMITLAYSLRRQKQA
ncbi:cytidylate kinase family protein [Candidatus Haliotispira prima]|uniref:(d)CMP kinase n=1 Tax=Candidatus Haliotispira prima TaxID=3034016 RepID=A0ABY8MKN5_9SPIO|nr:cytidylate kinase family protein [Candidatus Haliotispira prima]